MSRLAYMHQKAFSYKSDEWGTPDEYFDELNREFGFTLDAAATPENAKLPKFYTKEDNGLNQDWRGETVWLNPPYGGRGTIEAWVKKAWKEHFNGVTTVLLLPARPDVGYWHDYCMKGEIRYHRGRLKFINDHLNKTRNAAPFASALVIFRGVDIPRAPNILAWDGEGHVPFDYAYFKHLCSTRGIDPAWPMEERLNLEERNKEIMEALE